MMNDRRDGSLPTEWDLRARSFQTDLRGVLFKSFPPSLNRYLHAWHVAEMRCALAATPTSRPHVLDVGCGYGRLSLELRREVAQAVLVGIDRSPTFAQLFRRETGGSSIVSDLDGLPVRTAQFDVILLITTLMYLPPESQAGLLAECLRALKPDGRLLLVENSRHGRLIYSGFGLVPWLAKRVGLVDTSVDTGGHVFAYPEIERLIETGGGVIVRRRGVVRFTCLLPVLLLLCKAGGQGVADRLLRLCRPSEGTRKYSIHICYEVRRAAGHSIA